MLLKTEWFVLLCVAVCVSCSSALTSLGFGTTMSVRAYDLICWYEHLKQFPNTDSDGYAAKCGGQAENVKRQMKNDDKIIMRYFGEWMTALAMGRLPDEYGAACNYYLKNSDTKAQTDESDTLNDGQNSPYPFQGFSYCLLGLLRDKYGDEAIDAVKNEKTRQKKHWMTTILDRDNEFRARHGVPPMKLIKELNEQAQRWADKMAEECNTYHSDNDYSDRQWQNAGTGESLAAGPTAPKEDAAYIASNGWYEGIKDYPYPRGFKGGDVLFEKIGHFTQSVWKDTKYVGYGYAYNADCDTYQWYIAARYSPAGNVKGAYQKNILPPKF